MFDKLFIIGIGPGSDKYLLPAAKEVIETCDVLVGGRRNLDNFKHLNKVEKIIENNLSEVPVYIRENIASKKIALLVTGDTGIYSMLGFIRRTLQNIEPVVIPGISSLQYFASKLCMEWHDMKIVSIHGRADDSLLCTISNNEKTFIFTDSKSSPSYVCMKMVEAGMDNVRVFVGENLSYYSEKIIEGLPEEISRMTFESLNVMIVLNKEKRKWEHNTPGIPDDFFTRGNVPMTKEEIRALSISKLRLNGDNRVVDIGAGTGSIAVECGLFSPKGKVYAVEKEKEAIDLIIENVKKFKVYNVEVIHGKAPEVLEKIIDVDRVFIGGSGSKMTDIINWTNKNKNIRIVINTVTLESTYEAITELEKKGFTDIEILNVTVSKGRKVGEKHLMQALNPIYIISAEKRGKQL